MIAFLLIVFLAILKICSSNVSETQQQVTTLNGKQYLITSLSQSQTSDPVELAAKYGHADVWLQIYLIRKQKTMKMTESLSESIDNDEILLVPLEWTTVKSSPSSQTPSSPRPTNPPSTPSTPATSSAGNWNKAIATFYESYPTTSEEADEFSGDKYKGIFALFDDQKSESWVQSHSICAVSDKSWNSLNGKFIQISQYPDGRNPFTVQVVDYCSDSDCDGCCSANMKSAGVNFLIDLEKYTAAKFLGQTPGDIVKNSLFQVIYYSTSSAASANSDSVETTKTSDSALYIGLSVGGVVLLVSLVIFFGLIFKKKSQRERV